jgi:Na+-driven multidrug efflux pump
MVSNVIGQGKKEQVIFLIRKIVRISMIIAGFVAVALNLFPSVFLKVYGQDESFVEDAIPVVRIVSSALLLMSFSTVWLNAVTGTGNSKITLYIEILAIILYSVYVYIVLEVFKLPITIGWMSEYLYWSVLFLASFFYIRSGKWKGKVI